MCGIHALDSCRIEKAYRHFGHDITDEDHVVDAGLCFTADLSKTYFKGKEAILKKRKIGSSKKMLQFKLNDPTKMIYHNEPIIRENKIVGYLTSGNYGHTLGGCVGLGYVDCKDLPDEDTPFDPEAFFAAGIEVNEARKKLTEGKLSNLKILGI